MGSAFDIIKRVGAIFVVLVLIVMMGLIFSSQPIDEITRTVTGDRSAGEFFGEPISLKDYSFYEEGCRSWITERKLEQSKFFMEHCISTRMRQIYTLDQASQRLGIGTSIEAIKREVWDVAQKEHERQGGLAQDDRLPVNEIYRFNLSRFPLKMRLRQTAASSAYEILNFPFPKLRQEKKWEKAVGKTTLRLRFIYYDDRLLLEKIKAGITIRKKEILETFRKDQKKGKKKLPTPPGSPSPSGTKKTDRAPTAVQKERIKTRLENDQAAKELEIKKAGLNRLLKTAQLQKAQKKKKTRGLLNKAGKIMGVTPLNMGRVKLNELENLKAGNARIDLLQKKFLEEISVKKEKTSSSQKKPIFIGPVKSGPYTVYAEADSVRLPVRSLLPVVSKKKPKKPKKPKKSRKPKKTKSYKKEDDTALTDELFKYVVEEESSRGNFVLRHPPSQASPQR